MLTGPLSLDVVTNSVWAVPPLARSASGEIDPAQNRQIMQHIEAGGISTLLYGGNAIFYHLTLQDFAHAVEHISEQAAPNTLVIPAVGPMFGTMMDQTNILKHFDFPTVMVLPQGDIVSSTGIARGVRVFAERFGKPIVLYLKYDRKLSAADAKSLVDDGLVCAIKYAVVREDHRHDDYLQQLCDQIDPRMILSGLGDQPAIIHMRDFGLGGFTTGTGCVAPWLSHALRLAILAQDWDRAETLRETFLPLEHLRNAWGPITVLHAAVEAAGIAETGPVLPLLAEPTAEQIPAITTAAQQLMTTRPTHV